MKDKVHVVSQYETLFSSRYLCCGLTSSSETNRSFMPSVLGLSLEEFNVLQDSLQYSCFPQHQNDLFS